LTSDAAKLLDKARDLLARGQAMAAIGLYQDAGRNAYLAAFNAARALVMERTGRVGKTHRGVDATFQSLVRDAELPEPPQRGFLTRAFRLKSVADYETGPEAEIPPERVVAVLAEATRFLATIEALLNTPAPDGP
jgi:uncharacterized protein (UPF0332 family)